MRTRNDHHCPNADRREGSRTPTDNEIELRALPFNPLPSLEPNV